MPVSEERGLSLSSSIQPLPRPGGIASQSLEFLHRPSNEMLVANLLESPEIEGLIAELQETRWTGRPGYPLRAMVGMTLVKSLYALPTWTRTVALVTDHAGLRNALGCASRDAVPSIDACYRFTRKLRRVDDLLAACINRVLASLRDALPGMGEHVAIDGSDLPAYANGHPAGRGDPTGPPGRARRRGG
jgi:Transposase domain (DUF772)